MLYTIVAYIHNVNDRTIGKVTIWYKVREKKTWKGLERNSRH